MIKSLSEKTKKETPELNTLKVLLQSLKYQLEELDSTNKNINNLKVELSGGYQKEKKGKVKNFDLDLEQNSILNK